MARILVDAGIKFIADNEGRMPSLIAAICDVDEELVDFIIEAEAQALAAQENERTSPCKRSPSTETIRFQIPL
jgi:hypothetical protein